MERAQALELHDEWDDYELEVLAEFFAKTPTDKPLWTALFESRRFLRCVLRSDEYLDELLPYFEPVLRQRVEPAADGSSASPSELVGLALGWEQLFEEHYGGRTEVEAVIDRCAEVGAYYWDEVPLIFLLSMRRASKRI